MFYFSRFERLVNGGLQASRSHCESLCFANDMLLLDPVVLSRNKVLSVAKESSIEIFVKAITKNPSFGLVSYFIRQKTFMFVRARS